jgi:hypothetical protein
MHATCTINSCLHYQSGACMVETTCTPWGNALCTIQRFLPHTNLVRSCNVHNAEVLHALLKSGACMQCAQGSVACTRKCGACMHCAQYSDACTTKFWCMHAVCMHKIWCMHAVCAIKWCMPNQIWCVHAVCTIQCTKTFWYGHAVCTIQCCMHKINLVHACSVEYHLNATICRQGST